MSDVMLAVGTVKGLFLLRQLGGGEVQATGPFSPGQAVTSVAFTRQDSGDPRLLAGTVSDHWGPSVLHSDNLGETWVDPAEGAIRFPGDTEAALAQVWQLQPGNTADEVWAGVEPAALFRSVDGGQSFTLVQGLWDHPHRPGWQPGGGGLCLHSISPHPEESDRVLVAISTGGVYRTEDGGRSWEPSSTGIAAPFLPDPSPDHGQCVHKIARPSAAPERVFAQNHGGVYRSDDEGRTWTSIAEGLPSDFGFPIVVHPHRPDVVYTFPLRADMYRWPLEGHCRVYRSEDSGSSWTALESGLPHEDFYSTVLRDGMCTDDSAPASVYFGTRSGSVFRGTDGGEQWTEVAQHLPAVLCVRAMELS